MIFNFKLPTTPSKRHLIQLNNFHLKKKPFIKKKLKNLVKATGRNNSGKITINHKGNGRKNTYRNINFNRINNSVGIICSVEYDPNRNAHIASVFDFVKGNFFYILSPRGTYIGDILKSGEYAESRRGHSLPMSEIHLGSYFHNISVKYNKRAQLSLAAGTFGRLKTKFKSYVIIELSSKKEMILANDCHATLGIVSNAFYFLTQLGKAGNSRWTNKRPSVRGVAMNPIDHPNGGGEGKTSSKNRTPWGKPHNSKKIINKNNE